MNEKPRPSLLSVFVLPQATKGVVIAVLIATAATFVAEHYGGPQLLYALFFGLSLHFLYESDAIKPGVDYAARTLLRLGVVLLGARITLDQIVSLGPNTGLVVVAGMALTITVGVLLSKWLRQPIAQGLLSGGAVAICGASAAMAISAALPQTKENAKFTLLVVVGVTLLSTTAMMVYPYLTHLGHLNAQQSGIFLGATIHDVAQVVAAGMLLGPDAGAVATVVKLFRVLLLLPIVTLVAIAFGSHDPEEPQSGRRAGLFPMFLLGFLLMVGLSSAGILSSTLVATASHASRWLLVIAIAAAGLKTSFADLALLGWRPIVMLVGETLILAAFMYLVIYYGMLGA